MEYRTEHDTMGEIEVPADRYWGAQTERSRRNFNIGCGRENMPPEIIYAFALLKEAAARANRIVVPKRMSAEKAELIAEVCREIRDGRLDGHFPLVVWQTGSGTQTNMNVNEVISNRGNEIAGKKILHPNDDVNMSQSSNDTFPTAMNIAAVLETENSLLPSLDGLIGSFAALEEKYPDEIKTGRTHLQDAVPIKFAQEVSGWRNSLERDREMIASAVSKLYPIALGGTAVGTGLNAPEGFAQAAAEQLFALCGKPFCSAVNKFHALSSKSEFVFAHGALTSLASDLMKIANDIRWLASGPRCGLGEINIPANEPGSSIMPGKVNPTQCEAVTMVAVQVIGNDTSISIAAASGNFELNVYMPVLIYDFLQSVRLLSESMRSFEQNCVRGIHPNSGKMKSNLERSLMLVTALSPHIGYEKAADAAKTAYAENISLKDACRKLGLLSEEEFDRLMKPENMV